MVNDINDTPMYAKCVECSHVWPALYAPISLTVMIRILKGVTCPKCGEGAKGIDVYELGTLPEGFAPA